MIDDKTKLALHNAFKNTEIPAVKVHDHCDVCGEEIIEAPYVIGYKTYCSPCFFDWLRSVRKEK